MKEIGAAEFKARCLSLMDVVKGTGEPILITKKGRPVAKLVPPDERSRDVFGCLTGVIEVVGDILAPTVSPSDWDALR